MSHGKFDKGYLPETGSVTVTGPFRPDDREVNFARIIFLVVQGRARDTVVVRGEGEWKRGDGGEETEWRGTVSRRGDLGLGPSDAELQEDAGPLTRGIALSVVVQPGHVLQDDEFDPPSIEALTWCADFEIVGGEPPPLSSTT